MAVRLVKGGLQSYDPMQVFKKRGGGGGVASDMSIDEQKRLEAERKLAQQKAMAESERLRKEVRDKAEQARLRIEAERREIERIRKLSRQRQLQEYRKLRQISKGQQLLQLQQQGKKLTPQAQKIAEREFQRQGRERRQIRIPISEQKKVQSKVQSENINIFSLQSWRDLGEALVESKNKKDRKLGKKILTEPLLFASKFVSRTGELKELPAGLLALIKKPSNIKNIPSNIKTDFADTIQLLKTSKSQGLAKIGSDIFTFKIIGGVIKATGRVTSNVATRISPKFVGAAETGAKLKVRGAGSGRTITINIVGKIPTESIAKQIKRAGTKVSAISSQADSLVGLIKRKKIIRKPLPNESKLPLSTRKLLKKFDKGKITSKELIRLDRLIKKKKGKGILERSFFADPQTRIRPSRLGVLGEKEGTLKQLLKGEATLKSAKPQILLFEDVKISKFPKSLKSVATKLKNGKPLTKTEMTKLLTWQQKVTGKFKPLGFVTREAEITLAPNEVIKRVKKVGVTLVNGKRVPIISTKVIKPTKAVQNLIKKAKIGKATAKELKQLSKKLKKETGFKYTTSSLKKTKLYYPLKRKLVSPSVSKISRRKTSRKITSKPISKGKIRYTSQGRPYIITTTGSRFIPAVSSPTYKKSTLKGFTGGSSPKQFRRLKGKKGVSRPLKFARTKRTLKKKAKTQPVFNVFGKSGKKFVKINVKPLTKNDALSKGTYAIDRTTSRQFKIIPAGKMKKAGILRKAERNYFNRAGFKLREYKVKRGRKFLIKPKYVEKTKHAIDTRGEKKGLSLAKYLAQQRRGGAVRKKIKRKITPAQRKVMLRNLKKARAVRIKKLKGGKK